MSQDHPDIQDYRDQVDHIEIAWIPLKDGRRLAARLLLPKDAEQNPVPAILEYIPYRRRDGTRARDEETHYWFAAHGYGCARVDISGSGDSDGLIEDEYVKREQDDALEIIDWLAAQPWCSGAVGMIGISWGGFNGLQVAARRPKALKAVVSICSTVDRYHDDVHFMGGCLLGDNLDWGSAFFTFGSLPPDPDIVGEDRWRELWRERLDGLELYPATWLQHQRRDKFWRHGSVIEDYDAIECPVLAISGWADGYTAAVFHLVENLKAPCKGIVGPWGHKYPQQGVPGPAIGFLQECKRWWDRWLKDIDNDAENDPALRLYLQDSLKPLPHHDEKPGRWLGFAQWPVKDKDISIKEFHFDANRLQKKPIKKSSQKSSEQSSQQLGTICSPQTTGLASGEWCAYGLGKIAPELPLDQREDDAGSLVFDSEALSKPLSITGRAKVHLRVATDKPQALIAVRLNDFHPDGTVARIAYGLLNLSHRDSHSKPARLQPGSFYDVVVELTHCAQTLAVGHHLRIAVSTSYWPMVWPSPEPVNLTLDPAGSLLELPVLRKKAKLQPVAFEPVQYATPLQLTVIEAGKESRQIIHDVEAQNTRFVINRNDGRYRIDDIGTEIAYTKDKSFDITRNDPLTASASIACKMHYRRTKGGGKWNARIETETALTADNQYFYLTATIKAFDGRKLFAKRQFKHSIKRDYL